jgi:predicted alpha-1,6-mannanase (GH76 family)
MTRRRIVTLILSLNITIVCGSQDLPQNSPAQQQAFRRADFGVEALQKWYVPSTGLYRTTGWWNSANAITALADYMRISGLHKYTSALANTYMKAQITVPGEQRTVDGEKMNGYPGFLNKYYDDEGWWALAWIDAYDLTHDSRYLATAQSIFDDMTHGWDETCHGGIWWNKDRKYKNAIANELFLSVAAHLATRIPTDRQKFADWAVKEWQWFRASGMINSDNLINDGLKIGPASGTCRNNAATVWTYNQGVILGGLAELSRLSDNAQVLDDARRIADAALTHLTDSNGILHDPCEPKCGADGIQFKGIFIRNLRALSETSPDARYRKAIVANADSIWLKNRTPENTFGAVWSGPPFSPNAGTQASAIDALVAALISER